MKLGYVVSNPGCPAHEGYFKTSDIVVISERAHRNLISYPSKVHFPFFNSLRGSSQYLKISLPTPSHPGLMSKYGIIDHSFLSDQTRESKITELKKLVNYLVRQNPVGALFVTDIDLERGDVYAEWSAFWPELLEFMDKALAKSHSN